MISSYVMLMYASIIQWSSELQKRCAEIVGEVGEDDIYEKYQQGHRLAVAFCNANVTARLVAMHLTAFTYSNRQYSYPQ